MDGPVAAGYDVRRVIRIWSGVIVAGLLAGIAGATPVEFVRRGGTTLWDSEGAERSCLESIDEAPEADQDAAADNPGLFPSSACNAGKVLPAGTRLETVMPKGRCGKLTRVRVRSGRLGGTVGCVAGDDVSSKRVSPPR